MEKSYKEALERAREIYNAPAATVVVRTWLEQIFLELKESEDERVRKEILEYFNQYKDEGLRGANITPWIAYLEKQKEQKTAEWSEKHVANIFEKVGLAKIAREQGNDKLTNALQDAMIELSKVETPEWSKEEKMHLYNAIKAVKYVYDVSEGTSGFKCVEFLKSLRPQPHWKPSEEQMKDLFIAAREGCDAGSPVAETLKSLYRDLLYQDKKL